MKAKAILHIRYRQLEGLLREVPVIYRLILLIAGLATCFAVYQFVTALESALIICGGIALTALSIHQYRTDKHWVAMHSEHPQKIYFAEYAVISSPIWASILFSAYFYCVSGLLLILFIIGFIPHRESIRSKKASNWLPIPTQLFEWKAGMRSMQYLPLWIYLLAFGANYWPYVPVIALWFLQATMLTFYQYHEPREILELGGNNARSFLRNKIHLHIKSWALAIAPVLLLAVALHPSTIWVMLFFACFSILLQVFFIVAKYALYEPNTRLEGNQVIVSLAMFGILIPFLLPIPIVMGIRYYRMAIQNLNAYWDA